MVKMPKRLFPKKFLAYSIDGPRQPNPEMLALYHNSVKTTSGPKNKMEPVLDNSFTRPIVDGVAGRYKCSKCGRHFETTISWTQHLRKFFGNEVLEHEPIFEPDLEDSHPIAIISGEGENAVIGIVEIHHNKLPTPLADVKKKLKLWRGLRRQGFSEWRYFLVQETRKYKLYLGCNGAAWRFKKVRPSGEEIFSTEYSSKETALLRWDMVQIMWV